MEYLPCSDTEALIYSLSLSSPLTHTHTHTHLISSSDIDNPLECYNQTPSGEVDEKEVEVGDADVTFVPLPTDVTIREGGATPTMSNASPTKGLQLKMEEENEVSAVSLV